MSVCTVAVDTAGIGALSCVEGTNPTCFNFVLFIPGMLHWRFLTMFSTISYLMFLSIYHLSVRPLLMGFGIIDYVHDPEYSVHRMYFKSL